MKLFIRVLCLLPLASALSAAPAPVTELKVMSFNIWLNASQGLNNCVAVIRTNGADIVGLAECNATTASNIAQQLGFYWTQGAGAAECAIVSRYPLFRIGDTTVPYGGVGAIIELSPGQHVPFLSAHLNYDPYGPYWLKWGSNTAAIVSMENQYLMPGLDALLDLAAPYLPLDNPAFLVGDFNAPSHLDYTNVPWPTSIACSNAGFGDSYRELHPGNRLFVSTNSPFLFNEPGITWTPRGLSSEPYGVYDRIDFIHYTTGKGATPESSTELDAANGNVNPWPSDHRAVVTTFTLTPPVPGGAAGNPFPADGAAAVPLNALLLWTPSSNLISHAVYFGTNSPGTFQANTTNSVFPPGPLLPGTTYYWRVDTMTATGTVTGAAWSFTTAGVPPPVVHTYEWTFALGDFTPALGNGVLAFRDTTTSNLTVFGLTGTNGIPHLNGQPARYVRVPQMPAGGNGYYATFTDSGPNGGGAYINQYTIVQDVLVPSPLNWTAMFNTDTDNNNDADFYVSDTGAIGSTPGYSSAGAMAANTWYRVAVTVDLVAGTMSYFVNGTRVRHSTAADGVSAPDGRWSIYSNLSGGPDLLLFNEGDGSGNYTHVLYLHAWAFVDRTLSDAEIATLGGPKVNGIFSGPPISLAITRAGPGVVLNWAGGKGPFQVERVTSLTQSWQSVGPLSYVRSFNEGLSNGSAFYRVAGN